MKADELKKRFTYWPPPFPLTGWDARTPTKIIHKSSGWTARFKHKDIGTPEKEDPMFLTDANEWYELIIYDENNNVVGEIDGFWDLP